MSNDSQQSANATENQNVCGWQRDEDGNDQTDCGGTWCLNDGTPPENGMKFCPYCGKLIAWCSYQEDDDEDYLDDVEDPRVVGGYPP